MRATFFILLTIVCTATTAVAQSGASANQIPFMAALRDLRASRDQNEFLSRLKRRLFKEDREFLESRFSKLAGAEFPKVAERKRGEWTIALRGKLIAFRAISVAEQIYEVNNKQIKYESGESLSSRWKRTLAMLPRLQASTSRWTWLMSEAFADDGNALQVNATADALALVVAAVAALTEQNSKCSSLLSASTSCMEFSMSLENGEYVLPKSRVPDANANATPERFREQLDNLLAQSETLTKEAARFTKEKLSCPTDEAIKSNPYIKPALQKSSMEARDNALPDLKSCLDDLVAKRKQVYGAPAANGPTSQGVRAPQ